MEQVANPVEQAFNAEFGETPLAPVDTSDKKPVLPGDTAKDAQPPVNPPQSFRREIDLGDGSGKQVFEGKTMEEVADKLTQAQMNATRKIRQQNRELKAARRAKPADATSEPAPFKPLTADERFTLAQDTTALVSRFEEQQKSLHEMNERLRLRQEAEAGEQERGTVANEFIEDHVADYLPTPKNFAAIRVVIERLGLDTSPEHFQDTLEAAFQEIQTSGGFPDKPVPPADTSRIEGVPPKKPASSGISDQSHTEAVPVQTAQVVEEAYRIPLPELRERIQRRAFEVQSGKASQ